MNFIKRYYLYVSIFIINAFLPLKILYACVGESPSITDRLVSYLSLPILIILNIVFIKKINKKVSLILFIIFFNIIMFILWNIYWMLNNTFC